MGTAPSLPHGIGGRTMVALIGCFMMLQPISTDLYLASLPGLTGTFGVSIATAQLTLTIWVAAFGVMQLFAGPMSDRYGRYPVLLGGIGLYVVASLACAAAPSMEWLIAARCVQAIGCCAAVAVARAIVRDVYDPVAGARVLAQAAAILAIGPIFGPMLGSALEVRYGHRAAFLVQALVAAALLAATLAKLSETNPARNPQAMAPRTLLANYTFLLRSPNFRAYTLLACASYGGVFAFLSGSSFVLIRVLGVPTEFFGFAFASCVCGYLLGTLACHRLLARRSVARTLRVGASLSLASGMALVASALIGPPHWLAILGPAFAFFFSHGINFPCGQAGSVAPFPRHAGAASGLYGFLIMVVATLTGVWIGATHDGTVRPLAFTMAAFACVAFATTFGRIARRAPAGAAAAALDSNI
jgi:DHA1 family bicyclomycin/chloramphenicol resistance-like MFS transporter